MAENIFAMSTSEKFSIRKRIKSFYYAFKGLKVMVNEPNFLIHLVAAAVAIAAGFYFDISPLEWLAVILVIALVLSLEMINTAIEKLSDFVSPDKNDKIKIIKDVAAGSVLLAAIASVVIAAVIFVPRIIQIINH